MPTTAGRVLKAALLVTLWLALASNDGIAASIHPVWLTGRVLAGRTPIKNATVALFGTVDHERPIMDFASSEPVAETHTDAEGRFSFDLSKARAVLTTTQRMGRGPLVRVEVAPQPGTLYVVASGGDAGGGDNHAITLATALGIAPPGGYLVVNELTTVVAAFSVGYVGTGAWFSDNNQWTRTAHFPMAVFPPEGTTSVSNRGDQMNVTGGTPSEESLALACQLVDPVTGRLQPVFLSGANSPAVVNSLADILHSCVVSHGPDFAECSVLFQAATLPNPWNLTPHNTLTAIENITSKLVS